MRPKPSSKRKPQMVSKVLTPNTKGSKLRVTPMPIFYKVYVAYLDQKALGKRERGGQASFGDVGGSAEMARRQIARDIRLARKLAANVSCGEFPGVY